jgi:hypothetical protein
VNLAIRTLRRSIFASRSRAVVRVGERDILIRALPGSVMREAEIILLERVCGRRDVDAPARCLFARCGGRSAWIKGTVHRATRDCDPSFVVGWALLGDASRLSADEIVDVADAIIRFSSR